MTTNLQSRSASVSNLGDAEEPSSFLPGKTGASKNVGNNLRSASIGSSFFNKDASNFFNPKDAANTTSSSMDDELVKETNENPPDPPTSSDLDIVDALGTLNLDEEFELTNKDTGNAKEKKGTQSSNEAAKQRDTPTSNTPFLQHAQFLYAGNSNTNDGNNNYHQQFYSQYPAQQGSLTPNSSIGTFVPSTFGHVNTPSSTWSNTFIPSSAPPFAYGNSNAASANALNVKPFELPDDGKSKDKRANGENVIPGLHLPFTTTPPPLDTFGGVLNSQIPFGANVPIGMESYGFQEGYKLAEGSSSESEIESSIPSDRTKGSSNQQQFMSGSIRMDGAQAAAVNEYQLIIGNEGSHNHNQFNNLPDNLNFPMLNVGQMVPPSAQPGTPNMWNQIPMNYNSNVNLQQHSFVNNRVPQNQALTSQGVNGGRFNNNGNHNNNNNRRNHYNSNDGMNVHRKMHINNKRKGDDASKYTNAKLEDFTGQIYSLCKDQHGCRFLQRQLDLGREAASNPNADLENTQILTNDIAATMIFNEIYLKIIELMTDPFGNYLIQKLFENVSADQRIILVKNASPEFIRIALDPHGTRALQKLIECITTEEESRLIINSLSPRIVALSRDLNGNHVVQKCLQRLKPEENQFIFETASLHCNEIATHRHGCCVLQRCLDHGNLAQRKQLSLKVAENATNLSLDPFGNYVVQYVLSRGDDESIRIILDHIKANVVSLSLHKFGSNVIEKSLRINKLTDSLIDVLLLNKDRFSEMLNDAFGNYVLQTSLDVANVRDLGKLSQTLQPLLPNIKNTPHGRRIMIKIQNIL